MWRPCAGTPFFTRPGIPDWVGKAAVLECQSDEDIPGKKPCRGERKEGL